MPTSLHSDGNHIFGEHNSKHFLVSKYETNNIDCTPAFDGSKPKCNEMIWLLDDNS